MSTPPGTSAEPSGGPRLTAEFMVEPFRDAEPGPHVLAAEDAARSLGLEVVVGPFGSSITGPAARVLDAVRALAAAATGRGATRISVQITTVPSADAEPGA